MIPSPLRIAVFASGSGSNLEAILQAIETGQLPHTEVALVVSNVAEAGALEKAKRRAIPTSVLPPSAFESESVYLVALNEALQAHRVNFIALAGYLKKVPSPLVDAFRDRIVNIHPSLLPAFGGPGMYGARVHRAALAAGVRWSGATVHLVDEQYDTGPIVLQKPVPVHATDTPESLAHRILAVEHRLYTEALRLFAENRISIEGNNVLIDTTIRKP